MFTVLNKAFQASVPLALLLLLAAPSFAQLSLRRALDYDGDNKADFSVYRPTNNVWYNRLSSTGGFTTTQFGNSTTDVPCPGDYDGDGKGDICVYRDDAIGAFYYIRSSNSTYGVQQFGTAGDEAVARQWDGDAAGRTDFAVARRFNNQLVWYVLTNPATGAGAYSAVQFGAALDFVIPGDYDGDGKFDYAVQRAANLSAPSVLYILRSQSGTVQAFQYGIGADFYATGDYDGDGKTDICAVRDSGTYYTWYILKSMTNTTSVVQFGSPTTDLITQNDYDGDGKTDVSVWRDSTGVFYVLGSLGGIQTVAFGTSGDFPNASYDSH